MSIRKLLLISIVSAFAVTGCDTDDGPAEKAGESLDNAGDAIADSARDVGNAIEDKCEEIKENADAEDTDC